MQFERLGPYRLGKKLGQGGMGAVYQGVDATSGQVAAIKVLSPHLAGEEGFRVRFEAEIESLKKLRHPNIVRLYGYGEEGEHLFYAMELVDGTSLEEELRAGRRFDWREVTQLTIKLCKALKHAHDHGVIHRDIKPANLLLSSTGEIRLSDFGIARLFGNTRMTGDGGLLGTAEYMAPEQADGRPVTDRCDQYSLGGVMYALLAGRPPFRAASLVEMLQMQRYSEPQPVRRYAPDTPAELDRIIRQLLEKDPQKRFVNTLMLARALEAMERGLSLSSQRDDYLLVGDDAAQVSRPIDPYASTLVPSDLPAPPPSESTAPGRDKAARVSEQSVLTGSIAAPSRAPGGSGRFTKVEEPVADGGNWRLELRSALGSWNTLAVGIGLLAIAALAWYTFQGPSADQLFSQIDAASAHADPQALRDAQPKMSDFLARFPADARRATVQLLLEEVEEARRQRKLELQSRKLKSGPSRSAAEHAFREAIGHRVDHPELAVRKLQALLALYGSDEQGQPEEESVRLARAELKLLERQLADDIRQGREAIAARLATAERLAPDDPAAARHIWQAVITLYADRPWADDLVSQARQGLDASNRPLSDERPPQPQTGT